MILYSIYHALSKSKYKFTVTFNLPIIYKSYVVFFIRWEVGIYTVPLFPYSYKLNGFRCEHDDLLQLLGICFFSIS